MRERSVFRMTELMSHLDSKVWRKENSTKGAFQKLELAGRTMAGSDILAMN